MSSLYSVHVECFSILRSHFCLSYNRIHTHIELALLLRYAICVYFSLWLFEFFGFVWYVLFYITLRHCYSFNYRSNLARKTSIVKMHFIQTNRIHTGIHRRTCWNCRILRRPIIIILHFFPFSDLYYDCCCYCCRHCRYHFQP